MSAPHRIPTHPGAVLREDVLPAVKMPVARVAAALGISRQMLHKILAERAPITPEMAVRIGKFCGNGPDLWLGMQVQHDLAKAQIALADEVARIPTTRAA
jgi:addiction module HigA family antidote